MFQVPRGSRSSSGRATGGEGRTLLVRQQDIEKVMPEMDCFDAVRKLKNAGLDRSVHGSLIQELKARCSLFFEFCVEWCSREVNVFAHALAKAGCNVVGSHTWIEVPPLMLEPLLCKYLVNDE